MKPQLLFIIGAQRSGTTLLERMLGCHSMIQGGAEPHLLTPLTYLGVWAKVDKAPYDHIVAAIGQQAFVDQLPNKEMDYWRACRVYCDQLYASHVSVSGKPICLDKTPEYATILPFINKIYPDAKYIVITRHPVAIFSSFANSFFDGDYEIAQQHEPLLERYLPPIANFLRQSKIEFLHVHYEDLVKKPETQMQQIYDYLGLPFEGQTINYREHQNNFNNGQSLGDPLGIQNHEQPSETSLTKWVQELKQNEPKHKFMQTLINRLDPADLLSLGYPVDKLWQPMIDSPVVSNSKKQYKFNYYRIERKIIVRGRAFVRRYSWASRIINHIRIVCDVLLRE